MIETNHHSNVDFRMSARRHSKIFFVLFFLFFLFFQAVGYTAIVQFKIEGKISSSGWDEIENKTWVGEIPRWKLCGQKDDKPFCQEFSGFFPSDSHEILLDPAKSFIQSVFIYIHGLDKRPNELKFIQESTGKPRFLKIVPAHFFIDNRRPDKVANSPNQKDFLGLEHSVIHLFFEEKKAPPQDESLKFQVTSEVDERQWNKEDENTWFAQIYRFIVTERNLLYEVRGYYPSDSEYVQIDLEVVPPMTPSMYVYIHGIENKPPSLFFKQPLSSRPQFTPIDLSNFTLKQYQIERAEIETKEDFLGYEHPTLNIYIKGHYNYQVSSDIPSKSWIKLNENQWGGQFFAFKLKEISSGGQIQEFLLKGLYPNDLRDSKIDPEQEVSQSTSIYVRVNGFKEKPEALIFVQPITQTPMLSKLLKSHFRISDKYPVRIVASGNDLKDYLGYSHPVIDLFFEGTQTISPSNLVHQSLIVLDVTDDDRKAIAFRKAQDSVLECLKRIGWSAQNNPKHIKVAAAFENSLKYLKSIEDVANEKPKGQAPSSLKEQLRQAMSSFDDKYDGEKRVIYITSSKRADIITPYNLRKLNIDTEILKQYKKSFNCIIIGDYGGNMLKRLSEISSGQCILSSDQNEIINQLKAMITN